MFDVFKRIQIKQNELRNERATQRVITNYPYLTFLISIHMISKMWLLQSAIFGVRVS